MQNELDRVADNIPQACERLGISKTLIYKEIGAGRLKAVKAGRRTLITREAQQSWLASLAAFEAAL